MVFGTFLCGPKRMFKNKPNFSNRPVYLLPVNKDWLSIAKTVLSVEQQCKIYITGNNTGYTYKIFVTNYIPNSIRSCHMLDINAALKENNLCSFMVLVTHTTEAKQIIMSDNVSCLQDVPVPAPHTLWITLFCSLNIGKLSLSAPQTIIQYLTSNSNFEW